MKFTTATLIALNAIAVGAFAPSNPAKTASAVGPLNGIIKDGEYLRDRFAHDITTTTNFIMYSFLRLFTFYHCQLSALLWIPS
mmetsp:Transcript_5758/g.8568  ORF Transcript_5758/g.8568 Transcript_5758/m.8568 type:complete len:83 (+) Transcript_5758:38-286(+)